MIDGFRYGFLGKSDGSIMCGINLFNNFKVLQCGMQLFFFTKKVIKLNLKIMSALANNYNRKKILHLVMEKEAFFTQLMEKNT